MSGEGASRTGAHAGKAIVVGVGIGGLAVAGALIRHGWRVEVLGRATEFGEAGSGLSVWPNGVRALDARAWTSRRAPVPSSRRGPASGTRPAAGFRVRTPKSSNAGTVRSG